MAAKYEEDMSTYNQKLRELEKEVNEMALECARFTLLETSTPDERRRRKAEFLEKYEEYYKLREFGGDDELKREVFEQMKRIKLITAQITMDMYENELFSKVQLMNDSRAERWKKIVFWSKNLKHNPNN